jgi:DNA-binding transcriptional ArsR family regulator
MPDDNKQMSYADLRKAGDKASKLLKVMANSDRLILLCVMSEQELNVSQLEMVTNIRQPTLSQQLTVLRTAKLVSTRREGKSIFYKIASSSAMAIMGVLQQEICKRK